MSTPRALSRLTFAERLNFLVTNRLPRRWLTLATGRFSKIENPWLARLSIAIWRLFADDLRLHEARETHFPSLHACFVRELKDGTRPVDPDPAILTSPCDAVVGEFGTVQDGKVIQAKGFPYELPDLLGDRTAAGAYRNARFVTLRLKSSMYHHFHAPCAGRIGTIRYIAGDTWNVNPVALKVVEQLFCKNERVVIPVDRDGAQPVTLVAVAAILVASLRLDGLDYPLDLRYRGPNDIDVDRDCDKGDHLGYFEHGSTIVLLAPHDLGFVESLRTGSVIRMGEPLMTSATRA
jgi:phosphatidylserine decarboxylase